MQQTTLVLRQTYEVFARHGRGFLTVLANQKMAIDNFVLVDPFGNEIDVFWNYGEDGSGTNHELLKTGVPLRKARD